MGKLRHAAPLPYPPLTGCLFFGGANVLGYPGCWNLGLLVGEVIIVPLLGCPVIGIRGYWGTQLLGCKVAGCQVVVVHHLLRCCWVLGLYMASAWLLGCPTDVIPDHWGAWFLRLPGHWSAHVIGELVYWGARLMGCLAVVMPGCLCASLLRYPGYWGAQLLGQ